MIFKKLIFAPLFLAVLFFLILSLKPFLGSYEMIFSLSTQTFISFLTLSTLFLFAAILYILFNSFSQDLSFILPVTIFAGFVPFLFLEPTLAIVLTVGILVSLLLTHLSLQNTLKSYLDFKPAVIFQPHIKQLVTLLILSFSLVYFLSINKLITQNGFQIPDFLIDQALKLSPQPDPNVQGIKFIAQTTLTQDQINLLKQNPNLLKQYGVDQKSLDQIPTSTPSKNTLKTTTPVKQVPLDTSSLVKPLIKEQLQNLLKPYRGVIPIILAVLFFFLFQSFIAILSLFLNPLISIIFLILEKTGFLKFTEESRPVKKMVI